MVDQPALFAIRLQFRRDRGHLVNEAAGLSTCGFVFVAGTGFEPVTSGL
jgi:hypothetical protein